ncbi:transcriptional regulator [Streptomyces canus]|uniref:transcriptional regulator n=1 Tax=Streptomyces canus TaxID=58343 RepID=UPI00131CF210|nr:transcriptional regulator [Streptomyces canus]
MGTALGTTMLLPGTAVAASAPDLSTLQRQLVVARAQFRSAHYADLAEALPRLRRDALAAQAHTTGARRQAASALLARVHILASELAVKSGASDEAWERARSAVAAGESSGNVIVLAEATRVCATPLRRQGRAADAVLLLQDMITALTGAASSTPEPPLVSATGSLALTAAYSAALEGRRTTALSLMEMAADAAGRLARTPQSYSGGLTAGQVQLYQVGVHHLLGQDIAAVRAAQRLHPSTLPTGERRARLGTDTARALIAVGDYERALTALHAVEEAASEEASRPSVRALTRELLVRRPRLTGLKTFAARTGAEPL